MGAFRKTASPAAIATEVASLRWLTESAASGGAPVAELLDSGADWLTTRQLPHAKPTPQDAREFGRRLAKTHAAGGPWFGAAPPGLDVEQAVLAELPSPALDKPAHTTWGSFFAELRLQPYVDMAHSAGKLERDLLRRLSRLVDRIHDGAFDAEQPVAVRDVHNATGAGPSRPPAARVHGDLWGGNVVWARTATGAVGTLIDPSAHGGHAETDLAELALFGSPHLGDTLYGYQEISPLAAGWSQRVPIHQLHMLLVHVVLFGGGYIGDVDRVVRAAG